jgi:dTDP-4-amino-4,6-dideoxygalactose transaminase
MGPEIKVKYHNTHIPLIKPYVTQEVKDKVCEVLDSGYLTEGPVTREFENAVRDYIGCRFALAVCNCTVGLEMSLRTLGIGPGDEVIVPDYTYPATASVVHIVGARAVLVDIDPETMLIDYDALENAVTPRTRAVIPVSLFGNPLDHDRLKDIKKRHGIYIIEDAACSIGAQYRNHYVGNLADISVFSFHPRKFITTGEGGMVTTNHPEWAQWMNAYKHFGMNPSESRHSARFDQVGTNFKLSNLQAAVGLVQMRHIDSLLSRRTQLAERYRSVLDTPSGLSFPKTTPGGCHSWQSCCVLAPRRDEIIMRMKENRIETQIGTYALHMHGAYAESPRCRIAGRLSGSRYAFEHCLALPLYHDMSEFEQDLVIEQLLSILSGKD